MKSKYKSKYKGVVFSNTNRSYTNKWVAQYFAGEYRWAKCCMTEREAALAYDIKMIELGKEPVNILKQK